MWEFINPMGKDNKVYAASNAYGDMAPQLAVHKSIRYGKDDPRFNGKDMSVKHPLMPEGTPNWLKLLDGNNVPPRFDPDKK